MFCWSCHGDNIKTKVHRSPCSYLDPNPKQLICLLMFLSHFIPHQTLIVLYTSSSVAHIQMSRMLRSSLIFPQNHFPITHSMRPIHLLWKGASNSIIMQVRVKMVCNPWHAYQIFIFHSHQASLRHLLISMLG